MCVCVVPFWCGVQIGYNSCLVKVSMNRRIAGRQQKDIDLYIRIWKDKNGKTSSGGKGVENKSTEKALAHTFTWFYDLGY